MERALSRNLPDNVYCFLLIDDSDLSDFAVSAEDAAHTKFTKQKFMKEKVFTYRGALIYYGGRWDHIFDTQ